MKGSIPSAIADTSLAKFDGACKLLNLGCLNHNVFPSVIQGLFDLFGHINYLRCRNNLVPPMDEAVKDLREVEMVRLFTEFLLVFEFTPMKDVASSTQRSEWANIGMHRGIDQSCIVAHPLHVTWSIHPIDAKAVDRRGCIVCIFGSKFHDAAEVVGFARGLTNQVHMIW
jgi:hypothetical protein